MDAEVKFVIPTVSRAKISHLLSYPLGAERITEALSSVPQAESLKLQFFAGKGDGLRDVRLDGPGYEFLRVEYLCDSTPVEKYPISHLWPRPLQYRWEIVVQPVLRSDRHKIKQYAIESALPQIKDWLDLRANQIQRGSEILVFFYEQDTDEFVVQQIAHLEPAR
jgi:hypothetical protein